MSRIVGFLNLSKKNFIFIPELLIKMQQTIQHRGQFDHDVFFSRDMSLAGMHAVESLLVCDQCEIGLVYFCVFLGIWFDCMLVRLSIQVPILHTNQWFYWLALQIFQKIKYKNKQRAYSLTTIKNYLSSWLQRNQTQRQKLFNFDELVLLLHEMLQGIKGHLAKSRFMQNVLLQKGLV